jgi:predicted ribosome quality control (RQC) complex YloA/Tae2 family protein
MLTGVMLVLQLFIKQCFMCTAVYHLPMFDLRTSLEWRLQCCSTPDLTIWPHMAATIVPQVGKQQSSLRQVQVGRPYHLPPAATGLPPSRTEPLDTWRENITRAAQLAAAGSGSGGAARAAAAAATIQSTHTTDSSSSNGSKKAPSNSSTAADGKGGPSSSSSRRRSSSVTPSILTGCVRAYMGVSPSLVSELCHVAGVPPEAAAAEVTEGGWQDLFAAWQSWLERLDTGSFAPTSCPGTGR